MTAFDRYLPAKVVKALDLLADVAVLALAVVMITVGWKYASGLGAKGSYVSMPKVSRFWMYFPFLWLVLLWWCLNWKRFTTTLKAFS